MSDHTHFRLTPVLPADHGMYVQFTKISCEKRKAPHLVVEMVRTFGNWKAPHLVVEMVRMFGTRKISYEKWKSPHLVVEMVRTFGTQKFPEKLESPTLSS